MLMRTYARVYVYVYVCIYICICMYAYVCICVCTYVCIYVCAYLYIYMPLPTPTHRQDVIQGQFLSGVLTGLSLELSFF